MRSGANALLLCSVLAAILAGAVPAAALDAVVTSRFKPQDTGIADACMMANGHVALVLTNQGMIADYLPDGTLYQHIVREGGTAQDFRPTACSLGWDGQLYVFDEATHNVFTVLSDGNIEGSFKLKLNLSPGVSTAVSAVGGLHCAPDKVVWALLTDRGLIAGFNPAGEMVQRIDLGRALPYSNEAFSKSAVTADGTVYVLDYHQGAILRKSKSGRTYQRIVPFSVVGIDAAPLVQDFAVDEEHNLLIAANTAATPLVVLEPTATGYTSHALALDCPSESRISCSYSAGKYILWSRDEPYVAVLELR